MSAFVIYDGYFISKLLHLGKNLQNINIELQMYIPLWLEHVLPSL